MDLLAPTTADRRRNERNGRNEQKVRNEQKGRNGRKERIKFN